MRTRFETKILWTIFVTTALVGVGLTITAYLYFSHSIRQEFFDRYSSLNRMLGKSIVEAETAAEVTMLNAAYLIQVHDIKSEPLSVPELKKLVTKTGMTHAFLINRDGQFIRSTNEDPKLIPNLFSFCIEYRNIFNMPEGLGATPIIPPAPEPKPFKFLSIPNLAKTRIIHVGLRVDFIARLLKDFLDEDQNITRIAIFSPNGTSLGTFGANENDLERVVDPDVADSDEGLKEEKDGFKISNWIESAHPLDCQVRKLGNVRDGRYDYLIRASVSNRPLVAAQQSAFRFALFATLAAFIVAFFLARVLSRKIVYRLRNLAEQTRNIHSSSEALEISGSDEVYELGKALNELLLHLQKAQAQLIEAEKQKSLADLAEHVAHDIRSPLAALNVASSLIKDLPQEQRQMIQASIERISQIADDLLEKSLT
jgi:HAMP domain-containing protein